MAHKCDAIVVTCMDFRIQKYVQDWISKNLAGKTYDLIGYAGATKELDLVMEQISLSKDLHHINQAVLIHHEDCGAYGAEDSYERHVQDLNKAKNRILAKYPDLQVDLYYLYLSGKFEKI
ncbi:hypothetical protein KKD62_02705 [Patescibacteria group bacterium]|nr:hypothetical protein [Patescibacteria group bacterium]MBU1931850.1 hypothetical protein [Patescibacteria group bacterium]